MDGTWVVVPAYNEATTIGPVVNALREHFDHVLCVDDGSADDTARLARAAGAEVLRHVINRGQGAALQTGFDFAMRDAACEHVVTFDADGQHQVSDALTMLQVARRDGVDFVLGSRFLGSAAQVPWKRRVVLRCALLLSRRLSGLSLTDTHNGLRVLSRRAVGSVRLRQAGMAHASELEAAAARTGLPWVEVPTTVVYTDYSRMKGQSSGNAVNILFDLATHRLSPS